MMKIYMEVFTCLKTVKQYPLYIKQSDQHLFHCLTRLFNAVMDVGSSGAAKVDTITMQMQFIFSILWGLCSTVPEQSRKAFDAYFRNLIDGLVKGHAKPPSFKLGRSNLFGDPGTVFEYMISPEVPGTWCRWEEQMSLVSVARSGEGIVVPTSETLKQEFFLKLAIKHEFPLVMIGPSGTGKTFLTCGLIASLSTEKYINNL